jgi:hypothetical protein
LALLRRVVLDAVGVSAVGKLQGSLGFAKTESQDMPP